MHVKMQSRRSTYSSRPEHSGEQPKTRHVLYIYRWALHGSDSSIKPACMVWTPSGDGVAMQPARNMTGPLFETAIEWAHLCFLLLGSGSGDWAAGEKSQHQNTKQQQAVSGPRPSPRLAAALSRHHNGPFLPTCVDYFF